MNTMNNSALTQSEKKLIEDMVLKNHTDEQIATEIGRSTKTIKRYRDKVGLKKTGAGKLLVNVDNVQDSGILNSIDSTEEDKIRNWTAFFKQTQRYKRVKDSLIDADIDFFCHKWSLYHIQMEDMRPSEEDILENLIMYQVRINHNRNDFKQLLEREMQYNSMLGGKSDTELDLENDDDRWIFEMIMQTNRQKQEVNKELKDLQDKHDKMMESLNATRQQREARTQIGADTFLSLIKSLNDRDKRNEMAKYTERMKVSTETQIKKMKQSHEFADGTIEPILLDGSDFV